MLINDPIPFDVNTAVLPQSADPHLEQRGISNPPNRPIVDKTILSDNEPTRLPTNCPYASPDISLASNDIALLADWSVSISLASDHLLVPITINSELSPIDGPLRTHVNFKNADWARHAETCDKYTHKAVDARIV